MTLVISSLGVLALLATLVLYKMLPPSFPAKSPRKVQGLPFIGSLEFFTARWELFKKGIQMSSTGNFVYAVGPRRFVGLSGHRMREWFFTTPDLGFHEGYEALFGHERDLQAEKALDPNATFGAYFPRRITYLLKRESLAERWPDMQRDMFDMMEQFGACGTTDPFDTIYSIFFKLTVRTVGAKEIAEDHVKLKQLAKWYFMFKESAAPSSILMPWLPTPSKIKRFYAVAKIYMAVKQIAVDRYEQGRREEDPLQYLIDQGDSLENIVQFLISSLFAGMVNSAFNAAYILCHLAVEPVWLAKVKEEIIAVAGRYATSPDLPLQEQLRCIPIDVWESGFPTIDLCLRDCIRVHMHGVAIRRNVTGKDVVLENGDVVPEGSIVTYHGNDIHHDASIYKDPTTWDPSRYLPDRAEDKKAPLAYLGWGAGRHPCLGLKFAKIEVNLITALFVSRYDFTLVDKRQQELKAVPIPSPNLWHTALPASPLLLRYTAAPLKS